MRTATEIADLLDKPENHLLLHAILNGYRGTDGKWNNELSMMYHLTDVLNVSTEDAREISNYQGENLNVTFERIIGNTDLESGGSFGFAMRNVQRVLCERHMTRKPEGHERGQGEATLTDFQKRVLGRFDQRGSMFRTAKS